jgi:hypothetical protein
VRCEEGEDKLGNLGIGVIGSQDNGGDERDLERLLDDTGWLY